MSWWDCKKICHISFTYLLTYIFIYLLTYIHTSIHPCMHTIPYHTITLHYITYIHNIIYIYTYIHISIYLSISLSAATIISYHIVNSSTVLDRPRWAPGRCAFSAKSANIPAAPSSDGQRCGIGQAGMLHRVCSCVWICKCTHMYVCMYVCIYVCVCVHILY